MQLYLDETHRIFVLRQMKSIESMIMKEFSESSEEFKTAEMRRELIDEKITSIFENAERRTRK